MIHVKYLACRRFKSSHLVQDIPPEYNGANTVKVFDLGRNGGQPTKPTSRCPQFKPHFLLTPHQRRSGPRSPTSRIGQNGTPASQTCKSMGPPKHLESGQPSHSQPALLTPRNRVLLTHASRTGFRGAS